MKKKLLSILLSLAMVITMMPAMTMTAWAGDEVEPTPLQEEAFSISELVVEGWSVEETKEKLLFFYKNPNSESYEEYNNINYYFFDNQSNLLLDSHVFSAGEKIKYAMVIKAPANKYFGFVEENGYIIPTPSVINFNNFRADRFEIGTSADGMNLGFNWETYNSENPEVQAEIKKTVTYLKVSGRIDVTSQWKIFNKIEATPTPGEGAVLDRYGALYGRYFDTVKLEDNVYKITLNHDLQNNDSPEGSHVLLSAEKYREEPRTFIVDLNGYTIDANWLDKDTKDGDGNIFDVQEECTLIIEDSSEEKTGKLIGANDFGAAIENVNNLIVNGGTIIENKGYGIGENQPASGGIVNAGNLYLGGSTVVINNYTDGGKISNILCRDGCKIYIGNGTNMGLDLPAGYVVEKPVAGFKAGVYQTTTGKFTENATSADAKYFFSDNPNFYVAFNEANGGYLEMKELGNNKAVTTETTGNGTVYVEPQAASENAIVTVTVVPNPGYELSGNPVVLSADGTPLVPAVELTAIGNNQYTFKMPAGAVKVTATFVKKSEPVAKIVPVELAWAKTSGKKAVKLTWNKVSGATRYVVYGAKCGNKFKKLKTVYASKIKSKEYGTYTVKKIKGKKLKAHRTYKFYVVAYNGNKKLVQSKSIHFITAKTQGKYANIKSIKANKSKLTLGVGKKDTVKATVKRYKSKKHLSKAHGNALKYTSNCPYVATVDSNGVVRAKHPGTATIYIQDISGRYCKTVVTVN